jgi:hypothetical protein
VIAAIMVRFAVALLTPNRSLGSECDEVNRLWAFAFFIRFYFKGYFQTFRERCHASLFNGSNVNEDIPAAVVGFNEPVALVWIEKLHRTLLCHCVSPSQLPIQTKRTNECQKIGAQLQAESDSQAYRLGNNPACGQKRLC